MQNVARPTASKEKQRGHSKEWLLLKGLFESQVLPFFLCFCFWFRLLGSRPCVTRKNFSMFDDTHVFPSRQEADDNFCDTCARLRCVDKNSTLLKAYKRSARAKQVRLGLPRFGLNLFGGVARCSGLPKLSQMSLIDCLNCFFTSRQAGDWHRTINTPNLKSSRQWRVGDR